MSLTLPIDLAYPFRGRWRVQNSPSNRVPSHGTTAFASSFAIDFVPVDLRGRTAPFGLRSLVRPESASVFPGFGRAILSPAAGTVVAAVDESPDHAAYRGLPSVGYALSQKRRAAEGWTTLAGNHVAIDTGGAIVVLCHLRRRSITVSNGAPVTVGTPVAECGNTGNSTEPHLHLQVMDSLDADSARALRFTLRGTMPRNGQVIDLGGVG